MPTVKLSETERFSLALLLELEEDFPGCLDEMSRGLPAGSPLGQFLRRVVTPTERNEEAA